MKPRPLFGRVYVVRSLYTSPARHAAPSSPLWPRWLHDGSPCTEEACTGRRTVYRPRQDGHPLTTRAEYTDCGMDPAPELVAGGWICDGPDRHEGWITLAEVLESPADAVASAGPLGALMVGDAEKV